MTFKSAHKMALAACVLTVFSLAHSEQTFAKNKGKRLFMQKVDTQAQTAPRKQKRKRLDKNNQISLAHALIKPRPLSEEALKKEPDGIKAMTSVQKEKFFQAKFPDFTY